MTVIEIFPPGGWYTEILAPFLSEKRKYIMADPIVTAKDYTIPRKTWMTAHPKFSAKATTVNFTPPNEVQLGLANSIDMILTFRNLHNWAGDAGKIAAFKAFYTALKPGGILGVVDHRANHSKKLDPKSGYL